VKEMKTTEDVENEIKEMGYITVKPIKISPSYYKLKDGTIIEAIVRIDSIVSEVDNPSSYFVRTSNFTKAYVPKDKRDPEKFKNYRITDLEEAIIEDISSEELISEYSEYELSNGIIINIKTIVSQINKTKYYSQDGEPIYTVTMIPLIKRLKK
jgi:hypothetical protein